MVWIIGQVTSDMTQKKNYLQCAISWLLLLVSYCCAKLEIDWHIFVCKLNFVQLWNLSLYLLLVANAGESFAEQLDAAHQNSCPWRGNNCADSLVQLHLTQSALIGGFKDCCDGLLQFTSLPVIAPSAIENMKLTRSAQIDRLLSQSITFLSGILGCRAESTAGIDIHQDFSCSYSQVCWSLFMYTFFFIGANTLLFCIASSFWVFL